MRFYIVDVFAESRLSGNQLAVFRDCGGLTTERMQDIAREMHYSETTFVTSEEPRNGGYDVRVFTPGYELPFAGHPTLGTAYIVLSQIIGRPVETVRLNMKVGQIPVSFSYSKGSVDVLWMRQNAPTFGKTFSRGRLAKILGLKVSDIDPKFPIQMVSTGVPFVIVPLVGLQAIKKIKVEPVSLAKLFQETDTSVILVFSSETYSKDNDLNVRVFGLPTVIPEDPATGSGNGCLAAYLVKHRYLGRDKIDVRVEQGYEIDRKSLLLLRAHETPRGIGGQRRGEGPVRGERGLPCLDLRPARHYTKPIRVMADERPGLHNVRMRTLRDEAESRRAIPISGTQVQEVWL